MALGLVDGRKIYADSSMVEANALSSSFVHASPELISALREAYAVEESKFEIYEERQSYTPKSRTSFSFSDPDATMAGKERQGGYAIAKPRYKNHRVVDERCAVITAVETTPGHIFDGSCLVALRRVFESMTSRAG